MWTPAGTPYLFRVDLGRFAALVLALLLTGCGSGSTVHPVLAGRCLRADSRQLSGLSVTSPGPGYLRFRIEEHGLSVVATPDADPDEAVESPVERLGTSELVTYSRAGESHTLRIQAQDSPDITGEYCVRVDLLSPADKSAVSAEMAFAAAGRATHAHDWNTAFDEYSSAARQYDGLHLPHAAAVARHAMAEIAYLRFDNKRDSYALASQALADYGSSAPSFIVGSLANLQAKALLDMPETDLRAVAKRIQALQTTARRYFQTNEAGLANEAGARELPRVDIMAGFLAYRLDAFADARNLFAHAALSCRQRRDWDCYALASQDVALLEYEGKNYTNALSILADALSSLPPGLDPKLAADIWNNYGSLQGLMGLFSGSEHSHAAAMREYAQLGDCQGVRRNLARSGNLMVQLGSLGDAMNNLQQAASLDCPALLTVAAGNTATHQYISIPAAHNEAWCTHSLEPTGLAIENKLIVFNSLVSLGYALSLQDEPDLARRCIEAAQPYATTAQTRMRLADARGEVLLDSQDAAGARAAFKQALHIADEGRLPAAYEFRGVALLGAVKSDLLAGDSEEAVRGAYFALQSSVSRGDIDHTVASLRLLAAGYRGSAREQAARTLQTAVDLIEAVPINELDGEKRATYLATQYNVFAELTDLYASAADKDPSMASLAFATSERGRSRSLRYAVTQAERNTSASSNEPPTSRYQQLLQDVVNLSDNHAEPLHTNLVERLDAAALHEQTPEALIDQHQLTLVLGQLHATLVEYAVGTRDMFAFVLNENGLRVIRLGNRQTIATAAAELHDRLLDAETPQSETRQTARRLAELVLWPLELQLNGKRLIFVPDDGLHTIPFNVLPWSGRDSDQLVLQHAEVSIVPSALFLTRMHASGSQHASAPRIALLGDPVFRVADWRRECSEAVTERNSVRASRSAYDWTESLPRLPGSRAEVQMVARLTQQSRPASRVEMLLGCAAVPTALRRAVSDHVDLLHIATHARVDSQRPRLSALALTPERDGDGSAAAFGLLDILGLKLSSSLVVLSACETSRGRLLPGEGVLGPAQAFLQAGAEAVVASYWRVDDLTTSKFMQVFYGYLLAERLPAATALRKAQVEQSKTSPIHDWAAFSLYGWPDSSI